MGYVICAISLFAVGCLHAVVTDPLPVQEGERATASASPPCEATDRDDGLVELSGRIVRDKAGQITLGGVILGHAGRSISEGLVGKQVTVAGRRCVPACAPQMQCLTRGEMPYLTSLTLVSIDGERPSTQPLKAPHRGPLDLDN